MKSYGSQSQETLGTDSEEQYRADDRPATITFETTSGSDVINAVHHTRSDGWVSVWTGRDGTGIDLHVPRERVITIRRGRKPEFDRVDDENPDTVMMNASTPPTFEDDRNGGDCQ